MLGRPNNLKQLTNERLTDGDRYILHMKLCLEGYYSYKQSNAECLRTSYLIFLPYFMSTCLNEILNLPLRTWMKMKHTVV